MFKIFCGSNQQKPRQIFVKVIKHFMADYESKLKLKTTFSQESHFQHKILPFHQLTSYKNCCNCDDNKCYLVDKRSKPACIANVSLLLIKQDTSQKHIKTKLCTGCKKKRFAISHISNLLTLLKPMKTRQVVNEIRFAYLASLSYLKLKIRFISLIIGQHKR